MGEQGSSIRTVPPRHDAEIVLPGVHAVARDATGERQAEELAAECHLQDAQARRGRLFHKVERNRRRDATSEGDLVSSARQAGSSQHTGGVLRVD